MPERSKTSQACSPAPSQTANTGLDGAIFWRCRSVAATTVCAASAADKRGRNGHDQHGIIAVIFEQMLERNGITGTVGIAGDIARVGARPDGRKRGTELRHRGGGNLGQRAAEVGKPIDGKYADAAAIGQNRETIAGQKAAVRADIRADIRSENSQR